MDFKKPHKYQLPKKQVSKFSRIKYIVRESYSKERCLKIKKENEKEIRTFSPISGKVVVSLWVKLDIWNTGVNVLSVNGEGTKVICVDTEGAYFYAYTGTNKRKLCHFESDKWYSIYLSIDTKRESYSLYIDGEKVLSNAEFIHPARQLNEVSMSSYGGVLYIKRLHVYTNPVQSVQDETGNRMILDVKEMGICSDGQYAVTAELQKMIDSFGREGGVLYLKEGEYLSGTLELRENCTLYIESDAILRGTLDIACYPSQESQTHPNWNMLVQGPQKALIYADSVKNVAILGGGTIDGGGNFPGAYGSESLRVSAILLVGCQNVRLHDMYVRDAGMWTIPLVECENVTISDVNIDSTWYPNRDGIDLCDCYDVLVENCNIKSDDDALCFKSGNESGCDNVLVHNCCIISTMANGIKFGTYSYGGFTNCICADCIIKDTRTCAIVVQCMDGGAVRNLHFERIEIQNVESAFCIMIGDKGRIPSWGVQRIGSIEDVFFEDVRVRDVRRSYGCYLGGLVKNNTSYPIKNIQFCRVDAVFKGGVDEVPEEPPEFANQYPESNCFGNLPASAYYMRHAQTVIFDDCTTVIALPDKRPIQKNSHRLC